MFEDTKGAIRSRESKGRQYNGIKKNYISTKHYTENKRLNNTNPPQKWRRNAGAAQGYTFPVSLVVPVVLLLYKSGHE